jgi:hypothetical protein
MFRRALILAGLIAATVTLMGASPSVAADLPPGGTFIDEDGSTHEGSIEAIYAEGITVGCDKRGIYFCPNEPITRGQLAAFLTRALDFATSPEDFFADDNGSTFEDAINRIAAAGVTTGCNPPANTNFCPDSSVTREEMATLLARSFPELMPESADNTFTDDNSSVHEGAIDLIAAANITKGCNPPENTHYCPRNEVTRAEMATFLARALGLEPMTPPPQLPIERVSKFTTYHDCCQDRVVNIQRMARTVDGYVVMPGETFSIDEVVGPRTTAKGYRPAPYLQGGEGKCCAVGGGVSQFGTTIFNAVFWGGYQIDFHRPHSGWIDRYPLGIEATLVYKSIDFRFTNDTTTPVTIETSFTSTSITVELWGNQGGWQMSGSHPRGSRSSNITVHDEGGSDAKRVSASVSGSAPGLVKIVRNMKQGGSSTSQTWWWRYVS